MVADQEKKVSVEDENRNKRIREEEEKYVKESKKVKTGEEKNDEKKVKQEHKKEESQDKKVEDKKEKEQALVDKKVEEDPEKGTPKKEDVNSSEKKDSQSKNEDDSDAKYESNSKGDSDVKDSPNAKEKSTNQESKPKLVFGANSSFGSGFKVAGSLPLKSEEAKKELSKETGTQKPSAFGSGLSFGSGFGILKKSDKEDAKEKTPESGSDTKEKSGELSASPNVVKLQKQEIKSGEESEETIYQANAKLYQLADIEVGWKERGVGVIKVNKNISTGKSRLVMRSRGMLKVILNLSLVKGFAVQKGFVGSMQGEKFIRMVTQDDNKAPIQTAVKTGNKEIAEELYDSIVKLIPK
ncbi:hypothetical protein ZYGM_004336 [Zygosaccharomyces mellis]|uniref:RanBD1 domain-containing protein n=1 Tax=Zygosaccharomyces mellis TaxID=42258 RepID=A0A4C2E487_9SACH|nr:hypothetical protein ZYGM_004336 [Zygosaccharomyces mellis]